QSPVRGKRGLSESIRLPARACLAGDTRTRVPQPRTARQHEPWAGLSKTDLKLSPQRARENIRRNVRVSVVDDSCDPFALKCARQRLIEADQGLVARVLDWLSIATRYL